MAFYARELCKTNQEANRMVSLLMIAYCAILCLSSGDYRNIALVVTTALELYCTIYECVECVV